MNTQLLNAKSLFSITVVAACVALSGPVQAESQEVTVKIPVSTAGFDLNQPARARELYSRLRQAARSYSSGQSAATDIGLSGNAYIGGCSNSRYRRSNLSGREVTLLADRARALRADR
jgi:UrcA family protein